MTRTLTERFGESFTDRYSKYGAALEHSENATRQLNAWSGSDLRRRNDLLDEWTRAEEGLEAATAKIATADLV